MNRIKNPLVSVVVPVFNTPDDLLCACIKSVVEQNYSNKEILVVDDGSHELVAELCDIFEMQYPEVRVIHKEKGGVSSARNRGIEESSGEYLAFVDADDVLLPGYLSEAVSIIWSHNLDFVIGCHVRQIGERLLDESLQSIQPGGFIMLSSNQRKETAKWLYSGTSLKNADYLKGISMGACAKVFSRSSIGTTKFLQGIKVHEDTIFTAEIVEKCERIGVCYRPWYLYRQNGLSAFHGVEAFLGLESLYQSLGTYKTVTKEPNIRYVCLCNYLARLLKNAIRVYGMHGIDRVKQEVEKSFARFSIEHADYSEYDIRLLAKLRNGLMKLRWFKLLAFLFFIQEKIRPES